MFSFDLDVFMDFTKKAVASIANHPDDTSCFKNCKKEAKYDPLFVDTLMHYFCVCGYYLDCEKNSVLAEGCEVELKDKPVFHVDGLGSFTNFKQALLLFTMEVQGRRKLDKATMYSFKSVDGSPIDDLNAFDYRMIGFLNQHPAQATIYSHYRVFFDAPMKTKKAVAESLYFDLFDIVGPIEFPKHTAKKEPSEEEKPKPFENPEFNKMLDEYMETSKQFVSDEAKADPFFEKSHAAFIKALIDYVLEEDKDKLEELSDKTKSLLQNDNIWTMIWFLVMFESKVRLKGQDKFQLDIRMEDYISRGGNKIYYPTYQICPQKTANKIIDCAWKTLGNIVKL